jgi:hypothetical protein
MPEKSAQHLSYNGDRRFESLALGGAGNDLYSDDIVDRHGRFIINDGRMPPTLRTDGRRLQPPLGR